MGLGLGWGSVYLGSPYYYGYDPYYPYAGPAYGEAYEASPAVVYPTGLAPPPGAPANAGAQSALPPPTPASSWYYCESANGYYPYVAQCPEAWRAVPATPPGTVR